MRKTMAAVCTNTKSLSVQALQTHTQQHTVFTSVHTNEVCAHLFCVLHSCCVTTPGALSFNINNTFLDLRVYSESPEADSHTH